MKKSAMAICMQIITLALAILFIAFVVLYAIFQLDVLFTFLLTSGTALYHFAMRLCVGACVSLFSKKLKFNYDNFWFKPKKFEKGLYYALGVKNWKGNLPTYAPWEFSMDRPLEDVLQSMCAAELVHEIIVLFSFVPLLFTLFTRDWLMNFFIFLATSILAAGFDTIFIIAQRFNRPRVVTLKRMQDRKNKAATENTV